MSKKEGYSRRGFFGEIKHYDANGRKIGESRPGFFGGMNNYDANGHKIGESRPGFFGGMNHYDNSGHKVGKSRPGFLEEQIIMIAKDIKQDIVILEFLETGIIMMINMIMPKQCKRRR